MIFSASRFRYIQQRFGLPPEIPHPSTLPLMRFFHRFCPILTAFALLAAMQAASAQDRPGLMDEDYYVYAGVGVSNGLRVGASYRFAPHFAAEGSFGYVRMLNYYTMAGKADESTGLAPSLGISFVTSSDRSSYGIASLLLSYQIGTKKIVFQHERRLAITAAIGSEFSIYGPLTAQVRIGPTIHVILAPVHGATQLLMHYEGCIGWRL